MELIPRMPSMSTEFVDVLWFDDLIISFRERKPKQPNSGHMKSLDDVDLSTLGVKS